MSSRQKLKVSSIVLSVLILLLAPVQSQSQSQAVDQTSNKVDFSSLMLVVDRDGVAKVNLWFPVKLDDQTKVRQALTQSLGFPLKFDERSTKDSDDEEAALEDAFDFGSWTFIQGTSERSLSNQGMKSTTRLDFRPLASELRSLGIKRLSVGVMFQDPDAEVSLAGGTSVGPATGQLNLNYYHVDVDFSAPMTPVIQFSFGYSPADILRRSIPLAAFILLAGILTLWMRRSALKLQNEPAQMWGRCFHFWRLLMSLIYLIWIPICAGTGLSEVISFSVGRDRKLIVLVLNIALYMLTPLFVLCLAQFLSRPVYDRVCGVEWSARDVMRRAIATNAISLLPLFVILIMIGTFNLTSRFTGLFLIGAGVAWLFSQGLVNRIFNASIHAINTGELRDRIFELAHKAGVKVKQIYVLPESTSLLSNAFARSDKSVMITASLLKHLSKGEVDSIMAHEIGHLKEKHPQLNGYITLGAIIVTNIVGTALSAVIRLPQSGPVIFSFAILLSILILHFMSRSHERHADAIAIGLTSDPESFISGLAKLCRLNLMPLNSGSWGESLESHPRTMRRLQDIARVHGISEQRFQELVDSPLTTQGGYSGLNADEASAKAFSTDLKKKRSTRVALAMLTLLLFLPLAISLLLPQLHLHGPFRWLISFAGAVVTVLLFFVAKNFLGSRSYRRPAQQLRNRLEQQGFGDAAGKGILVGLAPTAQTRKYENYLFWDAGVLWLTADKLYYLGEETRFALERERIARIYWRDSRAEWLADRSLFVEWRDANNAEVTNALYFQRLGGGSLLRERRELVSLHASMKDWLAGSETFPESSHQLQSLPSPAFSEITSERVSDSFNPKLVFKSSLIMIFLSAIVSFAFRLSVAAASYSIAILLLILLLDELPKILKRNSAAKSGPIDPVARETSAYTAGVWAESNPAATAESVE